MWLGYRDEPPGELNLCCQKDENRPEHALLCGTPQVAALWFARQGPDNTKGVVAYEFPIETFVSKLGGKRIFRFLSPLDTPPITALGRSTHEVDYRFVVLELDTLEAEAARWRPGFYTVGLSPVEVVLKLGRRNEG
jgi:hypothetical protein